MQHSKELHLIFRLPTCSYQVGADTAGRSTVLTTGCGVDTVGIKVGKGQIGTQEGRTAHRAALRKQTMMMGRDRARGGLGGDGEKLD